MKLTFNGGLFGHNGSVLNTSVHPLLLKVEMVVYLAFIILVVVFPLTLYRFSPLSIILTLLRADGTTPAQRLFGQTFPYLFEWIVDDLGDLPLPRKSSKSHLS